MAHYTNIKDILKQFELQVVQGKHYKKSETMTSTEITTAISNAIAGVDQMHIVIASDAGTTPSGVSWTKTTGSSTTTITGTLTAANADAHTIYYVKSVNGTNDNFDEYMAVNESWEKIGNTDVDLSNYATKGSAIRSINFTTANGLTYKKANEDVTDDEHSVGTAANWRTYLGATDTVEDSSAGLATPKMVNTLKTTTISSSSAGVVLGGTVGAPTIAVTGGSVANDNSRVVTGGTVYTYITTNYQPKDEDLTAIAALTGTSGLLKKTAENTWALDTNAYLTSSDASSTYATKATALSSVVFDSTNGFRSLTVAKAGSTTASDFTTIVTIANLKSGLGINNVTNVGTESTITKNSTKNITSGAVYTALNASVSSSSSGITLEGTVKAPTITVTGGSVASGNVSVVVGETVYNYISGSSGVLYITDADFTRMLSEV